MKYTKPVNIWNLPEGEINRLQPGQWVYAGEPDNMGRFCGVKSNGIVVVAWVGNMRNHKDRKGYLRTLFDYAKCRLK